MVTWPPHMGALLLTMRPGSRTIKFSGVHPQSTPRFTSTSSKAIIVATTPATSIENIPAPTYDPTATFDTITRILSSGRASQKTLNRIALDLITPAHRLTPGRLRLVHFLSPPASTIGGGIVNLGRVSSGEEFNQRTTKARVSSRRCTTSLSQCHILRRKWKWRSRRRRR